MNISLIIPAYNEANLLTRTIDYVLGDNELQNCEIIVVCNGCKDNSIEVLTRYQKDNQNVLNSKSIVLKVIDEQKPSKTHALNIGMKDAAAENVVLLDADILVSGACIQELVKVLKEKALLALSPAIEFDTGDSSSAVKRYFNVSENSKYNKELRLSNVIALSAIGRQAVGDFPEVIADDEYLRRQLKFNEYAVLRTHSYAFKTPKDMFNLISVLSRVERGNMQLNKIGVHAKENTTGTQESTSFLDRSIFVVVKLIAKTLAWLQYHFGNNSKWQRDESTRAQ